MEEIRRKPTPMNAILSHCHECMGYYSDGREDCVNTVCQFYKWMPWGEKEPNLDWTKYHPKRMGLIKFQPPTEKQIEAGKRLTKIKKKGK
jgi:hypothetical protein